VEKEVENGGDDLEKEVENGGDDLEKEAKKATKGLGGGLGGGGGASDIIKKGLSSSSKIPVVGDVVKGFSGLFGG